MGRLKHDTTDDLISRLDALADVIDQARTHLRTYKQDDLLSSVCDARRTTGRLKQVITEIATGTAQLADREVSRQVLASMKDSPAPYVRSGYGAG